jgi:hypothetical protein
MKLSHEAPGHSWESMIKGKNWMGQILDKKRPFQNLRHKFVKTVSRIRPHACLSWPWFVLSIVSLVLLEGPAHGLSCPWFVLSMVCPVLGLSCPGFVLSWVCPARICPVWICPVCHWFVRSIACPVYGLFFSPITVVSAHGLSLLALSCVWLYSTRIVGI